MRQRMTRSQKKPSNVIVGTTWVALNLRIIAESDIAEHRLPQLSAEPRVRRSDGRHPARTIYHWSHAEVDSRALNDTIANVTAELRRYSRRLRRLIADGVRVELVLSVATKSDFGGCELSVASLAALAKLRIPLHVMTVANVDAE